MTLHTVEQIAQAAAVAPGEFRRERKSMIGVRDLPAVLARLNTAAAAFRRPFADRWINNLYWDTLDYAHLSANQAGYGMRHKVRLRWYGEPEATGSVQLEVKERRGEVGCKWTLAVALPLSDLLREGSLKSLVPPALHRFTDGCRPALFNRYRRQYFLSDDRAVRVTVDTETSYAAVRAFGRGASVLDPEYAVVELKYAPEAEKEASRVMQSLGLRATRSSKYVRGMELVAPWLKP